MVSPTGTLSVDQHIHCTRQSRPPFAPEACPSPGQVYAAHGRWLLRPSTGPRDFIRCLAIGLAILTGTTTAAIEHRTVTDVPYRSTSDGSDEGPERCRLDLHVPVATSDFATVVWFHGGGLTKGERELPRPLLNRGFAVVGAGYRLSPSVKAATCIEDAAAAVAWTFRSIADHGGNPNRIYVSGHSAGGYLAAMVGLDKRWLAIHSIDADRLAGIVPYSGQCITHFTIRSERGIPDRQPLIDEFAPLYHVRRDAPPLLLITGDREREMLGRYEENAYLWRMMTVAGHTRTRLEEIDGKDHSGMVNLAHPLLLELLAHDARRHEASKVSARTGRSATRGVAAQSDDEGGGP
jgi:acetyl esterase/lipase